MKRLLLLLSVPHSFALLMLAFFISGCVTTRAPTTVPVTTHVIAMSWQDRQNRLNQLQTWTIKGIVGIRKGDKGVNAHLNWQQQGDRYRLELFGPLGINSVQLIGSSQSVELINANQAYRASNPEALLEQRTGWILPVSNLYFWIRGLPAPGEHAIQQLDAQNRLSLLQQQGWQINYLDYMSAQGLDLPSKLELINNQVRVRIIINEWNNRL
jgi:outer membrane lipoprotein LolB